MKTSTGHLFYDSKDRLIVAIDNVQTLEEVAILLGQVAPYVGWVKFGFETIINFGIDALMIEVKKQSMYNLRIFADVKLKDIPNTMGNAIDKLNTKGVHMFNVHLSNTMAALHVASQKANEIVVIGVTVLTSFDEEDSQAVYNAPVKPTVLKFARAAVLAKLNGIVCSPQDLGVLAKNPELNDLLRITPGIQPEWMQGNDQKRVMTPYDAIMAGATAIVVGRAITQPPLDSLVGGDPGKAAELILANIKKAENELKDIEKQAKLARQKA